MTCECLVSSARTVVRASNVYESESAVIMPRDLKL